MLITFLFLVVIVLPPLHAQETGTFTDTRDGHVYKWVQIGNQTWMAENLAYLPGVNPVSDARFEGMVYYVYGYNGRSTSEAMQEASYKKYGSLYNYDAARESCPEG